MSKWDSDKPDSTKDLSRRDPDDFWDVESLLPNRPARRTPPLPRQSPASVEIELPSPGGRHPDAGQGAPVGAVPLTVSQAASSRSGDEAPVLQNPSADAFAPPVTVGVYASAQGCPSSSNGDKTATADRSQQAAQTAPNEPLADYEPDGALLHRVKVYGWQANYHYFDSFVEDALRFHAMKPPTEARRETFFSYFPQYVQLNRRSAAWYLYWREGARHGRYMDTDYAYILLYLFELINLPAEDISTAKEYCDRMASVWIAYRRSYPQLDHYMCEWLCDYCLIHGLNAPVDILAPALDDIIMESRLKEFYLSAAVRISDGDARDGAAPSRQTALATANMLMRHCCQYDYRKSKFANGEHKELFDSTIPAAVAHVLPLLLGGNGKKPAITMLDSTVTRDSYVGALCSYRNKRRILVAYTSFSRSHEMRFLMGDMVKHVENRLRSWIGVRSKLSVMSLPTPLRDALDAFLAPLEPRKSVIPVKKKEQPRPAYEALYDLPRKAVSLEDAAAIEADSWETTRILVEAFEVADGAANEVAVDTANDVPTSGNEVARGANDVRRASSGNDVAPVAQTEGNGESGESAVNSETALTAERGRDSLLAPYAPFIKAALDCDSAALRATAKALGKMPDALADEINALTADGEIGDIILEDDGMGGYTVIEDYREQVIELL